MIAPESFALNDVDGHAYPHAEEVPGELHDHLIEAARSCPEQAIIVSSDGDAAAPQNGSRPGGAMR
jgi:ferredoxin